MCDTQTLVNALAVSVFVSITPVVANAYVLKCTTVEGYPLVDMTIDLDSKVMKWGINNYIISDVTDEYITGLHSEHDPRRSDNPVGGEVLVLNRLSGIYKRAWVGLFCKYCPTPRNEKEDRSTVLRADTTTG